MNFSASAYSKAAHEVNALFPGGTLHLQTPQHKDRACQLCWNGTRKWQMSEGTQVANPLQKASFRRKFCQCCLHCLSAEFVAVLEGTHATCGLREQMKYGVSVTGVRASILFSQHFFALELFQLNLATYTRHVGAVCCDSSSSAAPF